MQVDTDNPSPWVLLGEGGQLFQQGLAYGKFMHGVVDDPWQGCMEEKASPQGEKTILYCMRMAHRYTIGGVRKSCARGTPFGDQTQAGHVLGRILRGMRNRPGQYP
ncbi:MAG: hypothetical protein HW380_1267 [Magnetococcales bacterium]|nr:hypothetical protein [Magnetococcales bacterium]